MQNLFRVLKNEHLIVKNSIKELLNSDANNFNNVSRELKLHLEGEEKAIYPVFREKELLLPKVIEALEEHKHAKMILNDLSLMNKNNLEFKPKLRVLFDMLDHHIKEEENEIFPLAKKEFNKQETRKLLDDYLDTKEDIFSI